MATASASDIRSLPLVAASRAAVAAFYQEHEDAHLEYHSFAHSCEVAEAADRIALLMGFSKEDHESLLIAAWWHDVGMLTCGNNPVGHEATSAGIVEDFLTEHHYATKRIELVKSLILATELSYEPTTELQQAMRDADLSGLGRPEYRQRLKALRKEWEAQGRLNVDSRAQWLEENIGFFNTHSYFTPAAQRLYGEQKECNKEMLEKRLSKRLKKKKKKKPKKTSPSNDKSVIQSEKSAQMMLKTTLRNNIDLTSIADGKANIMLSINAVIISIGIPLLAAYIPQFQYLLFPGVLLLLTSIATITFATLATRPVKTDGKTDLSKIKSGKTNLFFFGNYYSMPLDEYKKGLRQVFADQETLDNAVMNDLYWLGVALGSKFNRLRTCYAVFLGGTVLTIIVFIAAFYWAGPLSAAVDIPANVILPAGE